MRTIRTDEARFSRLGRAGIRLTMEAQFDPIPAPMVAPKGPMNEIPNPVAKIRADGWTQYPVILRIVGEDDAEFDQGINLMLEMADGGIFAFRTLESSAVFCATHGLMAVTEENMARLKRGEPVE